MNTEELLEGSPSDVIQRLTKKIHAIPAWSELVKDYDPNQHRIVKDTQTRRDKIRKDGTIEKAARIHIGMEKLHVSRMNEFTFGVRVKRVYSNIENNQTRQAISKALEAIYKHVRIDTENKRRGLAYYAGCEFFSLWYTVKKPNTLYGFNSQFKLKCKTFSPMDGVELYPLFDEYGDLLAMSFQYSRGVEFKTIQYFEAYTSDRHIKWRKEDSDWEEVTNEEISILKIPGVYQWRSFPIWHGLSHIREDIEYTLSRNSDVIAYNSAPILQVVGNLQGTENKGESQRIYRVDVGGSVSYVSWTQAIEALKYQVTTLLNLYWTQAQMPDISFDNMKALGNIGYDARQTLLTDAHLKVGDEEGVWIETFERECNVIKAFLGEMNTAWKSEIDNVDVEHIITPFIQNDESAEIDKWIKANGGKPIVSQLESIQNAGLSADPVHTVDQINKESAEAAASQMQSIMGAYE